MYTSSVRVNIHQGPAAKTLKMRSRRRFCLPTSPASFVALPRESPGASATQAALRAPDQPNGALGEVNWVVQSMLFKRMSSELQIGFWVDGRSDIFKGKCGFILVQIHVSCQDDKAL